MLYFQPFASIKLERMSQAFGWSIEHLERQVVNLIEAGEIQARVDRQNQVRSVFYTPTFIMISVNLVGRPT